MSTIYIVGYVTHSGNTDHLIQINKSYLPTNSMETQYFNPGVQSLSHSGKLDMKYPMKTRSVCLPPGRLQPGMTTATAILTRQGEELLPANCALDKATIDGIRRRSIKFIFVMIPDDRDMALIAREIATEEKRLAYIFRGEGNEARADLQNAVTAYRRNQIA